LEFWRKPIGVGAIGVFVTVVLVLMVVIVLLQAGDAKTVSSNAALIGALAGLGGVFTTQTVTSALEDQRIREERKIEAQRTQGTRTIEERRTQESRELEAQLAHEAALQKYFEQVGTLLIEKPLHQASPDDNLSTVV
jgi:hypothetical protein